jgi:hypothetical protein
MHPPGWPSAGTHGCVLSGVFDALIAQPHGCEVIEEGVGRGLAIPAPEGRKVVTRCVAGGDQAGQAARLAFGRSVSQVSEVLDTGRAGRATRGISELLVFLLERLTRPRTREGLREGEAPSEPRLEDRLAHSLAAQRTRRRGSFQTLRVRIDAADLGGTMLSNDESHCF